MYVIVNGVLFVVDANTLEKLHIFRMAWDQLHTFFAMRFCANIWKNSWITIEKTIEGTGMLEKENAKKRKVKKGKNSK